jgi:hypothetical protein
MDVSLDKDRCGDMLESSSGNHLMYQVTSEIFVFQDKIMENTIVRLSYAFCSCTFSLFL